MRFWKFWVIVIKSAKKWKWNKFRSNSWQWSWWTTEEIIFNISWLCFIFTTITVNFTGRVVSNNRKVIVKEEAVIYSLQRLYKMSLVEKCWMFTSRLCFYFRHIYKKQLLDNLCSLPSASAEILLTEYSGEKYVTSNRAVSNESFPKAGQYSLFQYICNIQCQ